MVKKKGGKARAVQNYPRKKTITPPKVSESSASPTLSNGSSEMVQSALLVLVFLFNFYFFVMSCIGLNEAKDGEQLEKDEWKVFFSVILIISLLMMVNMVYKLYIYYMYVL